MSFNGTLLEVVSRVYTVWFWWNIFTDVRMIPLELVRAIHVLNNHEKYVRSFEINFLKLNSIFISRIFGSRQVRINGRFLAGKFDVRVCGGTCMLPTDRATLISHDYVTVPHYFNSLWYFNEYDPSIERRTLLARKFVKTDNFILFSHKWFDGEVAHDHILLCKESNFVLQELAGYAWGRLEYLGARTLHSCIQILFRLARMRSGSVFFHVGNYLQPPVMSYMRMLDMYQMLLRGFSEYVSDYNAGFVSGLKQGYEVFRAALSIIRIIFFFGFLDPLSTTMISDMCYESSKDVAFNKLYEWLIFDHSEILNRCINMDGFTMDILTSDKILLTLDSYNELRLSDTNNLQFYDHI
jgi:hypothetical protein